MFAADGGSATVLLRTCARWMPQPSTIQAQPAPAIAPVSGAGTAG
jgi:hypothetical protein